MMTAPVPKPQIEQRGTKEKILTCKGDTTNAEPVSYSWSADTETLEESSNTITISKVLLNLHLTSVHPSVQYCAFCCRYKYSNTED